MGISIDPGVRVGRGRRTRSRRRRTGTTRYDGLFGTEIECVTIDITADGGSSTSDRTIEDVECRREGDTIDLAKPGVGRTTPCESDATASLREIHRCPTYSCDDLIGPDDVASCHSEDTSPELSILEEDASDILSESILSYIERYRRVFIETEKRIIVEYYSRSSSERSIDDITISDGVWICRDITIGSARMVDTYCATSFYDTSEIRSSSRSFHTTDRLSICIYLSVDFIDITYFGSEIACRGDSGESLSILYGAIGVIGGEIRYTEDIGDESSDRPCSCRDSRELGRIREHIRYHRDERVGGATETEKHEDEDEISAHSDEVRK